MPMTIAGLPFVKLRYDKNGNRFDPGGPVRPDGIGNLIVIAHGWKNSEEDADSRYAELLQNMRALPEGRKLLDEGRFGVSGVYWPSFVFNPDLTIVDDDADAPRGPAAATGDADVSRDELDRFAGEVAAFLEIEDPSSFKEQVRRAAGGGGAADELADRLRDEVRTDGADDEILAEHEGRNSKGRELFEFLKNPPAVPSRADEAEGTAMAGTTAETNATRFLAGPRAGVARLLNQFTYFEMKKRAGIVGQALAGDLEADGLDRIGLHLIGHSFGARLVTSAAAHMSRTKPKSMTLLQAAYSHYGLGQGGRGIPRGAFRDVVEQRRISGPIAITHTHNDRAVAIAYAVASRASGVTAAFFGGPKDPFGGMGANGAQLLKAGEAFTGTLMPGHDVNLRHGGVNNLVADSIITEHNDVTNPNVARVVVAAIR